MVQTPTRGENTLDLFATNNDTLVTRCDTIPGMSDHDCVLVESRLRPKKFRVRRGTFPVWKKANWNDIKTHLNEAWGRLPQDQKDNSTSDSLWVWFKMTLEGAIQKHVPHRQVKGKGRHPWISRSLKRLMRKEAKLFSKKKHQPKQHNISRHKQAQRQIQKKFRQEYWTYINQILFSPADKDTPPYKKTLWNYIKHCKKDFIGVGTLLDNTSGELLTEPRRKAELLNDQFQSVFSRNTPLMLKHLCQQATKLLPARETSEERRHPIMPDFMISSDGISKLLKNLKPNKAAGPNKIRPLVLRELREEIAPILEAIFTKSLDTGKLPDDWKSANVVPIYKKGSKHLPVNYRPVSLTCICSKLMEHIVVSQIAKHLDRHRILDPNQHGFRKGLSCETQLIQFVQELHSNTAQGKQVDAIVMDFSKAFDKVAHSRLLYKLDKYGIEGKTKNWIKDFLTNRSQQVVLDGMASSNVPVTSGVPQGSVLGPILFLIFINDISDRITSNIRLFANDTIIYRNIKNTEDAEKLQTDLHTLERWSREWQMEFHPSKCNTLHITWSRSPILRDYMLYNTTLEAVDSAKYLGVTLTTDLRFNRHIDNIRKNASGTVQFLKRNLRISSSEVKTQAYQIYVRPRLEYAASVWDPFTKTNKDKLEMVQRYSARWTLGRYHNRSSVTDMLNQQPRNEARGRAYVNDVQDEIGRRRQDVVPGASCWNRCQCSSASFHRPPNFQSATSKFLLPSLCKTMECTAGYSCPGTLAGILQTAGVPDQPLRLKLTEPTSLLTSY